MNRIVMRLMGKTAAIALLASVLFFLAAPLWAGQGCVRPTAYRVNVGMEIMGFNWSEYLDDGFKLLSETGSLLGLSYDLESTAERFGWRHGAGFFFGRVDYDGHTWSLIPVKTDVWYAGIQSYLDATYNFRPVSGLIFQPFAGIGGKTWLRVLEDTRTSEGVMVNGVEEWWWSIHGRVGAGVRYAISEKTAVFAEAGIKLPVHAQNNAYVNGSETPVRILQDQTQSPFAACGMRYGWLTVTFAYESQRFDKSDPAASGSYILYQPRSKEDIFAVRAAWSLDF